MLCLHTSVHCYENPSVIFSLIYIIICKYMYYNILSATTIFILYSQIVGQNGDDIIKYYHSFLNYVIIFYMSRH
ncbi:hypothetical protein MM_0324 [Methanosarcina mazei Go1]|uniref:Uncharacterized protein n=1 Tax=Methanosarcina mazei (strain ATCC BAA-159 / DSM 3647 / Goe1 / Go1 / JCM 11833 / OCM 88) TaxID=192952 RepID=Q8Q014_METMA|nr:hypothetical protein MM_0324 [Methanosarcina mazei Go1]